MGLLSPAKAAAINQAAAERGGGGSNFIKEAAIYVMTVDKVEHKTTKNDEPALVLTFQDKDKNYAPIDEWFVLPNEDAKGWEFLAKRLQAAGTAGIPVDVETHEALAKFVKKAMLGKKFQVAIKIEMSLQVKGDKMYKNKWARIWYIGAMGEEMSFDITKAITELKPEDQARWDAYCAGKGIQDAVTATQTAPAASEDLDLDNEAVAEEKPTPPPVKKATEAKPAPAKAAPAAEAGTEDAPVNAGDDLDFL